jgi:hypothetical protein
MVNESQELGWLRVTPGWTGRVSRGHPMVKTQIKRS